MTCPVCAAKPGPRRLALHLARSHSMRELARSARGIYVGRILPGGRSTDQHYVTLENVPELTHTTLDEYALSHSGRSRSRTTAASHTTQGE